MQKKLKRVKNYSAIQRFPEAISFFLKLFKNEEELESQITDYILDVKEATDQEFKTEQIPEEIETTNKDEDEGAEDEASGDEEDENEIIDNSPDRELVAAKIIIISDLYEKYKSQKDQTKAEKVFTQIIKEISNFKFTSLFIEKLTARIENVSRNITKYEKDVYSLCNKDTTISKKTS